MYLSIIIPLFNEKDTISPLLEKLLHLKLPEFVTSCEIIIVDDCSTDQSYQNALYYNENYPQVKLIRHKINSGKGSAVRTGIENSSGNVFLMQDADLELYPEDIPSLLEAMKRLDVDFVNGSRYMQGIIRPLFSYKRYLVNRFFTFLTSIIINVKITDMACGYKLFRRDLYEKLKLHENGFGFEAELIIKALRINKVKITEVPVNYFPRNQGEGKKFRNSDGLKVLWTIIRYGLFNHGYS
jgi:glycosyltransferase involved in cell wall biosynthesis